MQDENISPNAAAATSRVGCDSAQVSRPHHSSGSHRARGLRVLLRPDIRGTFSRESLDTLLLLDKVDYSRVQKLGGKGLEDRLADRHRRYPAVQP